MHGLFTPQGCTGPLEPLWVGVGVDHPPPPVRPAPEDRHAGSHDKRGSGPPAARWALPGRGAGEGGPAALRVLDLRRRGGGPLRPHLREGPRRARAGPHPRHRQPQPRGPLLHPVAAF